MLEIIDKKVSFIFTKNSCSHSDDHLLLYLRKTYQTQPYSIWATSWSALPDLWQVITIMKLGKLESLKKRRKGNRLILLYKGLKSKASVPTDDLIPKNGRCRNQHSMAFQTPIVNTDVYKGSFFPRLSGIGMPSPILWSHLLKMQRIVLLSSLLWWELGTNSLITGPGEWLSFRRFTSKLSWSWAWWKNLFMPYANNKGADQPVHLRSLISAFVVRCLDSIIPLVSISNISSL